MDSNTFPPDAPIIASVVRAVCRRRLGVAGYMTIGGHRWPVRITAGMFVEADGSPGACHHERPGEIHVGRDTPPPAVERLLRREARRIRAEARRGQRPPAAPPAVTLIVGGDAWSFVPRAGTIVMNGEQAGIIIDERRRVLVMTDRTSNEQLGGAVAYAIDLSLWHAEQEGGAHVG